MSLALLFLLFIYGLVWLDSDGLPELHALWVVVGAVAGLYVLITLVIDTVKFPRRVRSLRVGISPRFSRRYMFRMSFTIVLRVLFLFPLADFLFLPGGL